MDTTILFVRHGETEWNRNERFRGRYDIPLNTSGIQQAKRTAQFITSRWKPSAVYSSPLSRAFSTAQAIASACEIHAVELSGLIDTHYGEWQGLTPAEVRLRWPDLLTQWYRSPEGIRIPGGEDLSAVRSRAIETVEGLSQKHANETLVVVSHTDVIRLLLMTFLNIGIKDFWRLRQDNCAISLVSKKNDQYTVDFMNCSVHLIEYP